MHSRKAESVDEVRGVEVAAHAPAGYLVLQAIAADGVLCDWTGIHQSIDTPAWRDVKVGVLWESIERYERERGLAPLPRPIFTILR
jgi:hypothetical protein